MDNYTFVSRATVIEMYKKSQKLSIFTFKKKSLNDCLENNSKNDFEKELLKQLTHKCI